MMSHESRPTALVLVRSENSGDADLRANRLHAACVDFEALTIVIGNFTIPSNVVAYYFEVSVKSTLQPCSVTVGFLPEVFKPGQPPGHAADSFGYSAKDGNKHHNSTSGDDYGPAFGHGDTVGVGCIMSRQQIFFTKNGASLPSPAFSPVTRGMYPAISMGGLGEAVEVNFGQKPFLFDLEALVAEERAATRREMAAVAVPRAALHSLVRQYLVHHAYVDTLTALDGAAPSLEPRSAPAAPAEESAHCFAALRKSARCAILQRRVDEALEAVERRFPGMLATPACTEAQLCLHCQQFTEMLLAGRTADALAYGREHLRRFQQAAVALGETQRALLQDTLALLAYADPAASPVAHLTTDAQRMRTADAVSAAILRHCRLQAAPVDTDAEMAGSAPGGTADAAGTSGRRSRGGDAASDDDDMLSVESEAEGRAKEDSTAATRSALDSVLRQLQAVHDALHEARGGQGEPFEWRREMMGVMQQR